MYFKRSVTRVWVSALAGALISVGGPAYTAEESRDQGRMAVVNGSVITASDLDHEVGVVQSRITKGAGSLSPEQMADVKRRVLENLINMELLYQEAGRQGINVSDATVNERLAELKKGYGGDKNYREALSKMQLSEPDVASRIRKSLVIQEMIEKQFAGKVQISEKEAKAYYDAHPKDFEQPEQVRARHILIKADSKSDASTKAAARKKIEDLQKRIKKGEDFETLAKASSECPSSAKGGDLGFFSRGAMVKPFEAIAFSLKPGEVSDIVETPFGFHLIQLVDKKPGTTLAYEDVKDRLKKHMEQEKIRASVGVFIEDLRGKATVDRFLN